LDPASGVLAIKGAGGMNDNPKYHAHEITEKYCMVPRKSFMKGNGAEPEKSSPTK
jgi:hypothetical protein